MKKIGLIFIFIFLTGLFSGIFFSTELSAENKQYLSSLLLSGVTPTDPRVLTAFLSSAVSNLLLLLPALLALLTPIFSFVPPGVLWCKSFAVGFCSGLIYLNDTEDAFTVSLLKFLPPNLFLLPGFLLFTAILFLLSLSLNNRYKKSRFDPDAKSLRSALVSSLLLILVGIFIQAAFHLPAL